MHGRAFAATIVSLIVTSVFVCPAAADDPCRKISLCRDRYGSELLLDMRAGQGRKTAVPLLTIRGESVRALFDAAQRDARTGLAPVLKEIRGDARAIAMPDSHSFSRMKDALGDVRAIAMPESLSYSRGKAAVGNVREALKRTRGMAAKDRLRGVMAALAPSLRTAPGPERETDGGPAVEEPAATGFVSAWNEAVFFPPAVVQ